MADDCTLIEGMPDAEAEPLIDAAIVRAREVVDGALRLHDERARFWALWTAFGEELNSPEARVTQAALFAEVARRAVHAELPTATILPWRPRA